MTKLTNTSEPSLSPNRTKLAKLISDRNEATAETARLQAATKRLSCTIADADKAQDELRVAEANEAAAMRAWAMTGEGDPPRMSDEERRGLVNRAGDARACAEAARSAFDALQPEIAAAHNQEINRRLVVNGAIADVLVEEVAPLVAAIRELHARMAPLHDQLSGLVQWAYDTAHQHSDDLPGKQQFFRLGEAATEAAHQNGVGRATTPEAIFKWSQYFRRLENDHTAQVEA